MTDIPVEVVDLLLRTDECGMECFDEGDGPMRAAQRAETLGLASVSSWRGGWQYRLTERGVAARAKQMALRSA